MTSTPARFGMPGHFGIRITDAGKDKLVGELDVDDRHLNNSGHVHGGALAAFADDLGGALAGLNVPPGFRTTTIESKTNIFRACVPGRLTGVAVPVHVGRRTIVLQTSIYRADGKLAAMMIQTQMVLPRDSGTPAGEAGTNTKGPDRLLPRTSGADETNRIAKERRPIASLGKC